LRIENEKFERFINLLLEWNSIHNLTGAKTKEDIRENIEDSIYPFKYIDMPNRVLDIGSGAGFPALILAIAYPNINFTLCEPRNKRASFLRFVSIELELDNIIVIKKRVENFRSKPFELITSRAVSDTKILLDITKHLRDKTTRYLLYKGNRVKSEIEPLRDTIDFDIISRYKRNYLYIKEIRSDN
jgi:16S rRNA (guanine527-N7)-methyltransferase